MCPSVRGPLVPAGLAQSSCYLAGRTACRRAAAARLQEEVLGHKTFWKQVDSIRSSEIIIFAHGAEGDFIIAFAWVKQG